MKKITYLLFCLVLGIGLATAQTTRITGIVISADDGEPVIGATVFVKGTTTGTVTEGDGSFSLDVPGSAKTLVISYVGMATQEVAIQPNMQVVLQSDTQILDEVIVVAYGTAKRSSFTGSAATINTEKLVARQTSNISNALTGQVAGVQTTSSSGRPGGSSTVRIRGIGSMYASNTPLYVVDGVPYDGDLAALNSSDIESLTVLKDASANALYGARGANGVILITTKKGRSGEAKINVNARWGGNKPMLPRYDVMTDPNLYMETAYKALYNTQYNGSNAAEAHKYVLDNIFSQNNGVGYQVYTIPNGQDIFTGDGKINPATTLGYSDGTYYYTPDSWYDEIFGKAHMRQEYTVDISGAVDKFNYYISGGYLDDKGIMPGSGYQRISTRLKGDYQVKKWLQLGANVAYTHYFLENPRDQSGTSSGNMFYVANGMAPVYPLYARNPDGSIMIDNRGFTVYDFGDKTSSNFVRAFMAIANPMSLTALDQNTSSADDFSGRWFAHLDIWDGLKLQVNIGHDVTNTRTKTIYNAYYGQYAAVGGIAYVGHNRSIRSNQQYLLTYNKTFNDVHTIDFLGGFEKYDYKYEYVRAKKEKLYNPEVLEVDNAIMNPQASSYTDKYAVQGFLFRAQYEYEGKYILSGSYRRDGSSRFHVDNRWGNFWSVGGGWLLNQENFINDIEWVNMLKFKISYGQQGNDRLLYSDATNNYYPYQDQYELSNNNGEYATTLIYKGNKDITWETSHSFNTGFDFALFKNRLMGTAEFFTRQTSDMLYHKPVPPSLGYARVPVNIGSMRNTGVEVDLNGQIVKTRQLMWSAFVNATHVKNKIIELDASLKGELIDGTRIYTEGESMYRMYLRNYAGPDPETGKTLYYKDIVNEKGDVTEAKGTTTDDWGDASRYATGDILPKVYGGFGTTVEAYGFDLSVALAYQLGGRMFDGAYQSYMHQFNSTKGANWHHDILNAWTPENKNTDIPRLNALDTYTNSTSDRFMISSNYLTLQNITAGYTLPKKFTSKFDIASLRLYFVADNVAMLAARKGLDPRQSYTSSNVSNYTAIRTLSGGIQISF
ncbi:MAG: TonB-dependent receptor [Tannerella sp.]|nr:TonB-dependent receptor [Tannerella sp.]